MFERILEQFRNDTSQYEVKIAILNMLIPVMKKAYVERLFKVFQELLNEPAENSIFKKNVNPFRTGLMLYKLVFDLQAHFSYSEYTTEQILGQLNE